jgi:hypothetical protein
LASAAEALLEAFTPFKIPVAPMPLAIACLIEVFWLFPAKFSEQNFFPGRAFSRKYHP